MSRYISLNFNLNIIELRIVGSILLLDYSIINTNINNNNDNENKTKMSMYISLNFNSNISIQKASHRGSSCAPSEVATSI